MTVDTVAQDAPETLDLPGRMHLVLAALAAVPIAIIVIAAAAMAVEAPPLPFIGVMGVAMICCGLLAWQALSIIIGGKLQMTPEGLTVTRLFQQDFYPWQSIEHCKVIPATGTLGDDALADADQRVGVGLFLRGLDRQRDHDLDADVVLCAGDKANVQAMMRIAKRVEQACERVAAASRRRPGRSTLAPSAAGRPLRRRQPRPEAAAKPADLVARFRNASD